MSARDDYPARVGLNHTAVMERFDYHAMLNEIDSLRAQLAAKVEAWPALLAEHETLRSEVENLLRSLRQRAERAEADADQLVSSVITTLRQHHETRALR